MSETKKRKYMGKPDIEAALRASDRVEKELSELEEKIRKSTTIDEEVLRKVIVI